MSSEKEKAQEKRSTSRPPLTRPKNIRSHSSSTSRPPLTRPKNIRGTNSNRIKVRLETQAKLARAVPEPAWLPTTRVAVADSIQMLKEANITEDSESSEDVPKVAVASGETTVTKLTSADGGKSVVVFKSTVPNTTDGGDTTVPKLTSADGGGKSDGKTIVPNTTDGGETTVPKLTSAKGGGKTTVPNRTRFFKLKDAFLSVPRTTTSADGGKNIAPKITFSGGGENIVGKSTLPEKNTSSGGGGNIGTPVAEAQEKKMLTRPKKNQVSQATAIVSGGTRTTPNTSLADGGENIAAKTTFADGKHLNRMQHPTPTTTLELAGDGGESSTLAGAVLIRSGTPFVCTVSDFRVSASDAGQKTRTTEKRKKLQHAGTPDSEFVPKISKLSDSPEIANLFRTLWNKGLAQIRADRQNID
jgi:hypothetical protein